MFSLLAKYSAALKYDLKPDPSNYRPKFEGDSCLIRQTLTTSNFHFVRKINLISQIPNPPLGLRP